MSTPEEHIRRRRDCQRLIQVTDRASYRYDAIREGAKAAGKDAKVVGKAREIRR